jgi:hypothetical protein
MRDDDGDGDGERSGASDASGEIRSIKKVNTKIIITFIRTRECRRAVINRYLNGKKT